MFIDLLGWAAFLLVLPSGFFQVIKNYKRKSAEGLSFLMFSSLFTGMLLFFIVSLFRVTPLPTTIQFGVAALVYGTVLLQMRVYKNHKI